MTIVPPAPDEPRRPHGPQDPGDAWVVAETGEKYWGRYGAAGVLAVDPSRGVLLQHRVGWSHFGGTWGIPGGARHEGESAADAAIRESQEEAGVPDGVLAPVFTSVLDLGVWSYTTLIAQVTTPFEPSITDPESTALAWVAVDGVDGLELHPGFAASWPALRAALATRVTVIVDAANVVGSVPDGWWRDRAGAAERLLTRLDGARLGIEAADLDLPGTTWFPRVVAVLEGAARAAESDLAGVDVVRAEGAGDDALVARAEGVVAAGERVIVVTSDRGLSDRATAAGATVRPVSWLLDRI